MTAKVGKVRAPAEATRAEGPTVGAVRGAVAAAAAGIDPEALATLAEAHGYTAHLQWAPDAPEAFDAVLLEATAPLACPPRRQAPASDEQAAVANEPLQGRAARVLVPELRRHLQQGLPDYMVPATVILLDALPLTPNGKVDRAALPSPDPLAVARDYGCVPPRTPVEETIARVWSELLGVPQISVYDNFFGELGGHSLLATQVCSRLREAFDVEVSLRAFFESPTIADLAGVVEDALLSHIEQLSDDEVQRLSDEEGAGRR